MLVRHSKGFQDCASEVARAQFQEFRKKSEVISYLQLL